MSKLSLLALILVTATGGCATGTNDEPWTPPAAATKLDGDRVQVLSGADIPSTIVVASKSYFTSRHIVDLEHAGLVTPDQAAYAHALDGVLDEADGRLDAAELVEVERGVDFAEERAKLAALWEALSQF
jgi:hypothetical protein